MKKLLLLSVLVVFGLTVTAQQKGKIRVGLNYGYVFANEGEGGGILANLELKYNLGDFSNIGFQAGFAGAKSNLHTEVDVNWNVLGTYDYYFNKNNSLAATPFLGAGLGIYLLGDISDGSPEAISVGSKFGCMIRGGLELGKLRLALDYNILPNSNLETGLPIYNSYFGLSIGCYFGGGIW